MKQDISRDKLDGAVVQKDTAAARVVVVEGKQFRSAVLVPTGFGLEKLCCPICSASLQSMDGIAL